MRKIKMRGKRVMNIDRIIKKAPVVARVRAAEEVVWENPGVRPFEEVKDTLPLTASDIDDAEARLAISSGPQAAAWCRKRSGRLQ